MGDDGWGRDRSSGSSSDGVGRLGDGRGATRPAPSVASGVATHGPAARDASPRPPVRPGDPPRDRVLPGCEGAPCAERTRALVDAGGFSGADVRRCYTVWNDGAASHLLRYTCVFTCPSSGEHFACGRWENGKGGVAVEGSTYWYNKKAAKNAAAARYLDCMSLRRCHGTERLPHQRCTDPPYLEGEGPPLPAPPPGVELPAVNAGDENAKVQSTSVSSPGPAVKQALIGWYASYCRNVEETWGIRCRMPELSDCYACWSNMRDGGSRRFTCVFVCPLTGERFASGRLANDDGWTEDYMFFDEDRGLMLSNIRFDGDEDNHMNGSALRRVDLVWYRTRRKAEEAAAGRALDCLCRRAAAYSDCGDQNYRCCAEDPYPQNEAPDNWSDVGNLVVAAEDMVYEGALRLKIVYAVFGAVPEHERVTARFGVEDMHCLVGDASEDDGWKERYRDRRANTSNLAGDGM